MKTNRIANLIFTYQLGTEEEGLSLKEVKENLDDIMSKLRKHPRGSKAYQVASDLEEIMIEYANEKGLCEDCYSEALVTRKRNYGYYQPRETTIACTECGWSITG